MISKNIYQALAGIHPEFGKKCYVYIENPKIVYIEH